jgi:hypothetical protein
MSMEKLDDDFDDLSRTSQSNEGSVSTTDKTNSNASYVQESELAQRETKLVKRSKCLVLFVLLAAAAGCGAGKLLLSLNRNKSLCLSPDLTVPSFSDLSLHSRWRGRRFP